MNYEPLQNIPHREINVPHSPYTKKYFTKRIHLFLQHTSTTIIMFILLLILIYNTSKSYIMSLYETYHTEK